MLVEGIEKITVANGLLRISFTQVNAAGEGVVSGEAFIPVGSVENVVNTLVTGVNDLNAQLAEKQSSGKSTEDKSTEKKDNKKNKNN